MTGCDDGSASNNRSFAGPQVVLAGETDPGIYIVGGGLPACLLLVTETLLLWKTCDCILMENIVVEFMGLF